MDRGKGERYDGAWQFDRRHGRGELTRRDGSKVVGRWVQGLLQGPSLVVKPDGREERVIWRDGIEVIN